MLGRVFGKLLYWAGKRWLIGGQASDFTEVSDVQPLALCNGGLSCNDSMALHESPDQGGTGLQKFLVLGGKCADEMTFDVNFRNWGQRKSL